MENSNLNVQQSLAIIDEMISHARQEITDNGFFYLLWGWLVIAAALGHYALLHTSFAYPFITWPILMPLGGITAMVYGIMSGKKKNARPKTWINRAMGYIWGAFGFALLITLAVSHEIGWNISYPFMMVLYGIGTFISGGLMRFKPLIFGAMICWGLAVTAFFVEFDVQLLLMAASILVSYIIPGHWLQINYRRHVQRA